MLFAVVVALLLVTFANALQVNTEPNSLVRREPKLENWMKEMGNGISSRRGGNSKYGLFYGDGDCLLETSQGEPCYVSK